MATAALSVLERGSGAASDVSHPLSTHNEDWDAPAQPHRERHYLIVKYVY